MSEAVMRAVRFHDYGPPDVLHVDEVSRPEPGEGEVLVRVHAAGVNPIDWKYRAGYLKDFGPLPLPHTPGFDLSGTVEALGPGVTDFTPGQAVFGRGSGTYAEYAIAPATALAPKPDEITYDQAATIAIGGLTAWSGLIDVANVQPGQRVLVQGAAGGVGSYVVQLAHWKGAHVLGTSSAANLEYVRSIGADEAIDYRSGAIEQTASSVDVVFDTVGGNVLEQSWGLLKEGGILIEIAGTADEETAKRHGVRIGGNRGVENPSAVLRQLADLIVHGDLRAEVGQVFPLDAAAQAHEASEKGHGRGRIVLHVTD
jgi:NADPH:quinone reductase-like Zn-dependent oxidoreductase